MGAARLRSRKRPVRCSAVRKASVVEQNIFLVNVPLQGWEVRLACIVSLAYFCDA